MPNPSMLELESGEDLETSDCPEPSGPGSEPSDSDSSYSSEDTDVWGPEAFADEVCRLEKEIQQADEDVDDAKELLKQRRETREAKVRELRSFIRMWKQGGCPLFDGAINQQEADNHGREDDTWQSVRLDTLGLPRPILDVLQEAEIEDMGGLSGYLEQPGTDIRDIKGITEKRAKVLEDALERFWEQRRRQCTTTSRTT